MTGLYLPNAAERAALLGTTPPDPTLELRAAALAGNEEALDSLLATVHRAAYFDGARDYAAEHARQQGTRKHAAAAKRAQRKAARKARKDNR